MKIKRSPFVRMMEADAGAGGAGTPPPAAAPATPPATPPPASTPPADAEPPAGTPPPAGSPPAAAATPPPADDPPPSALGGETPPADPPPAPVAAAPDTVDAFVESIKIDLGNGPDGKPLELNRDALKAIAPAAMKHKVGQEAIAEIVSAYAGFEKAANEQQAIAAAKQDREIASNLYAAAKKELGAEFEPFVSDARTGGKFLFGDAHWAELVSIPAFSNDVRVIKAFAQLGRMVKNDPGAGHRPAGEGGPKDFAEKWINSSNRGKE